MTRSSVLWYYCKEGKTQNKRYVGGIKELLFSGTTETIQSVSDSPAFSNRSYFYTCFQRIIGMSTTEYRKDMENETYR